MIAFPQRGSCLCGDIAFDLLEDPLTVYVCHCTDCQRQTGSSFALTAIVIREALKLVRGTPEEYSIELHDGRIKQAHFCARCATRLWEPSSVSTLAVLEPGTLDDTSWIRPVGHIWMRSAQPWISIPDDSIVVETQPSEEETLAMVRAWKRSRTAEPLG